MKLFIIIDEILPTLLDCQRKKLIYYEILRVTKHDDFVFLKKTFSKKLFFKLYEPWEQIIIFKRHAKGSKKVDLRKQQNIYVHGVLILISILNLK